MGDLLGTWRIGRVTRRNTGQTIRSRHGALPELTIRVDHK